jgi:glycosyltransferase involved in cell wall biosynthesis
MRTPAPVVATVGADPNALATAAAAIDAAGRADVMLVTAGARPPAGWVDALRAAAATDTTIASASAMCPPATPAPTPLSDGVDAADAVQRWSARIRPRIAAPAGNAVLLRRAALDAAGALDAELGDLPAALVDWGERCTALGLGHVLVDDVLVAGPPARGATSADAELDRRWPQRHDHRETLAAAPALERAMLACGRGLAQISVTLDCRALTAVRMGTQVHALEVAAALLRTGRVALRALVPPDLDDAARAALASHGAGAELLDYRDAAAGGVPVTGVVHRPSQVFSADDLALLVPLGRRLVITHQDLIAYRIPAYHADTGAWQRYRSMTRHALGAADDVVFFSEHARADALADDLVDTARTGVVPIGVDHSALPQVAGAPPPELRTSAGEYVLCLGTDLRHKHRVFALRLLGALRAGGWEGRLVLAGGHAPHGSSREDEERLLAADPALAAATVRLGAVEESERRWLTEHAAAVLYPTLYEGFGLVPFEAAAAGVPTLFAAQSSLVELLPAQLAVIEPWDSDASAAAALPLLTDEAARAPHVEAIAAVASRLTWDRAAHALVDRYEALTARPPREATSGPRARLRLEQSLDESERIRRADAARFDDYKAAVGRDALGLVGPGGLLDTADQRALLAVAARPPLRRMLFAGLRAIYAIGHRKR